jgi:Leucine Rich repeats (2 copies)
MQDELRDTAEQGGQITWQKSELARSPVGGSPALAEIMSKSLVHIQTSKALATRHRIGEHELCWPDYSLVCAWAEELRLTPEETIRRLLVRTKISDGEWDTRIEEGRFKSLCVSTSELYTMETLSVSSIPSIKGLVVEALYLRLRETSTGLDLSLFPNLTHLECRDNHLTELDISRVPNLTVLECGENQLSELDLSHVPNLTELECDRNQLSELNLSDVPNLTELDCRSNQLTKLDLSHVPNLTRLSCSENPLIELDLSHVPNLSQLGCQLKINWPNWTSPTSQISRCFRV